MIFERPAGPAVAPRPAVDAVGMEGVDRTGHMARIEFRAEQGEGIGGMKRRLRPGIVAHHLQAVVVGDLCDQQNVTVFIGERAQTPEELARFNAAQVLASPGETSCPQHAAPFLVWLL